MLAGREPRLEYSCSQSEYSSHVSCKKRKYENDKIYIPYLENGLGSSIDATRPHSLVSATPISQTHPLGTRDHGEPH